MFLKNLGKKSSRNCMEICLRPGPSLETLTSGEQREEGRHVSWASWLRLRLALTPLLHGTCSWALSTGWAPFIICSTRANIYLLSTRHGHSSPGIYILTGEKDNETMNLPSSGPHLFSPICWHLPGLGVTLWLYDWRLMATGSHSRFFSMSLCTISCEIF